MRSFSITPTNNGAFNRYIGDGSSDTPYEIRDVYDLQAMDWGGVPAPEAMALATARVALGWPRRAATSA